MTVAWVIGGRGLLGSALVAAIGARSGWRLLPADPLPWDDPEALSAAVDTRMRDLITAPKPGEPWTVVWAAGAAVTSSSDEQIDHELTQLNRVLDGLAPHLAEARGQGSIFYASSAGGIYAGSVAPPFTEVTKPAPISAYGRLKLAAEQRITAFAAAHGLSVLIGRIANLYGPGQRLGKMQGLISHIALAQYSTTPAAIYVPLDTVRDYLYAPDCAELVLDGLERLHRTAQDDGATAVTKILASGQPVTIAALLGSFRAIAKARPHVMLGNSPSAALQAQDVRLRSVVWPELDARDLTPLPVGIRATINDILAVMQVGAAR